MPSYVTPKKNTAYVFSVSLVSQSNTKTFQASPTLAAGDVKVVGDAGTAANITTLPTVDSGLTKRVIVSLSAAEMNFDNVVVLFSDAAGAEWCDLSLCIQTSTRQIDDLATPTNITAASGVALTTAYDPAKSAAQAGDAMALVTGAITASKIASGALNGKGDWLLASGYTAPDNTTITWLKNVLEGDDSIDTGVTPWARVVKTKSTNTELIRKKLRDVSGSNIMATTVVIGSAKES